jgi:CHAT domain-containing protein
MDRVISSYVPTLKVLSYSRKRVALSLPQKYPEILFVSMPRTPGHRDLSYVVQEIAALDCIVPTSAPRTILTTPSKKDVQQNIRSSQIVHFACHGKSNLINPSQSQLLLSDYQSETFAVTDIIALRLAEPRLAYLSACYAANIRVEGLLDESIHIASAFQLAGFPHVIGTLWTINDCHSVNVSKAVYTAMVNDKGEVDVGRAAEGLHSAVRQLRETRVDDSRKVGEDPLVWASYIYLGA